MTGCKKCRRQDVMVEGWDDSAREGRKWMSTWETAEEREACW